VKNAITAQGKRWLAMVLTVTTMIGWCGCTGKKSQPVDSVETMTLTLMRMRNTSVYEFAEKDGKTELRRYQKLYSGGEDVLQLEKSAVCDSATLSELMNACGVNRWDGFHGKHPKNVKDGTMFHFSATVNGGQEIWADGSENFPKGYHEFVNGLEKILGEGENN